MKLTSTIILFLLLFLFSLLIRLQTINQIGRTWDESLYVEQGYKMVELMKKGDFNNSYLYTTYDHPPLVKYLYGLVAGVFDVEEYDTLGNPVFLYDYTFARVLSAVVSSLAVIVVALIGWQFISKFVGVAGGIILSMLPFYVGLSQLVSTESFIMLFFSLSVFAFLHLLKKYSFKKMLLVGILTGISLQVKQSNVLLFPMYAVCYYAFIFSNKKGKTGLKLINASKSILVIGIIATIVFIIFWPLMPFHLNEVMHNHNHYWVLWTSPPEVFFGRLVLVPYIYYPVLFVITTPLFILALFLIGLKVIDTKKKWFYYCLVIWFFLPFIQSFYPWRQHGVRYIIQIYAPLSLIAAIGFESTIGKTARTFYKKFLYFIPVMLYLAWPLYTLSPYYLDYFNGIVGGTKGVYEKRLFQIGWWGQGIKEAGKYVSKNAVPGQRIGLALSPVHVYPYDKRLQTEKYDNTREYDYVVVNYYNILREGFDDTEIKEKYKPVYFVNAGGAVLVTVYKKQ